MEEVASHLGQEERQAEEVDRPLQEVEDRPYQAEEVDRPFLEEVEDRPW